jgi:hypothetical protein
MYIFSTKVNQEFKNVNINLRHETQILTEEFGINVLYVRNNKFVKCKCFDDLNKTGKANCPLCHGTGYFESIQMIPAIESSNSPYSSNNSIAKLQIGVTDQKNEVYYIQQQYVPKERDFLLKVTWDKNKNPIDVIKVLELINIWDTRGDNGRTEFFACLTNNRTDLVNEYNKTVKSLPQKAINEILKGGKYIWPAFLQH